MAVLLANMAVCCCSPFTPMAESEMVWPVVGGAVVWGARCRSMNGAKQTGREIETS